MPQTDEKLENCRRCGSLACVKVTYHRIRVLPEPMTIIHSCKICDRRWREEY
jgi:DNA-directed RNA polymerase subunit M/transcription elongation factor TFIIS